MPKLNKAKLAFFQHLRGWNAMAEGDDREEAFKDLYRLHVCAWKPQALRIAALDRELGLLEVRKSKRAIATA